MFKSIPTNLDNLILNTDAYKPSHYLQYPEDATYTYSYIEPRGGRFEELVVFGLQAFIKEYLTRPVTMSDIDEAEYILGIVGEPFNRAGWERIVNVHGGFLPLQIRAVQEGTVIPKGNVIADVCNTDPTLGWLGSYVETALLRATWYASNVATLSYKCKKIIKAGMELSCDSLDGLEYKLHDFGSRGASSRESATIGGLAHLTNFCGTDTLLSVPAAARWYGATDPTYVVGRSIPAAEHGTITSWGKEGEVDAYRNMLKRFLGPNKAVAVVSDAYDLWNAIENIWGDILRNDVTNSGGVLVVRPDSGIPAEVVVKSLTLLGERFGYSLNSKGYKLLPPCIRLIQGDGINLESLSVIIDAIHAAGWSLDNVTFGMGGGLLQDVERDDGGWCQKVAAITRGGVWHEVFKDPITGQSKRSKAGLQVLTRVDDEFKTMKLEDARDRENLIVPIFNNGNLVKETTLRTVRETTGLW